MTSWCGKNAQGVRISVQVSPNAKKTEVVGVHGDSLRIKLKAPPVDGKANDALIKFIAERLKVPKSSVQLMHGAAGRRKLVEVSVSLEVDEVMRILVGNTENQV